MNLPFGPLTLGDIFEKTFSMIGKTALRNCLVGLLVLLFPIIVMAIAADEFYTSAADMQGQNLYEQGEVGVEAIFGFVGQLAFFGFATILFMLGILIAEIAVSILVSQELHSHPITALDALRETFSIKCLYGLGQGIVKYAIFIGAAVVIGIVIILFAVMSEGLAIIAGVIVLLALFPVILYCGVKWMFGLTAVAVDDLGVIDSLRKSWNIVQGYWWRTLGIFLLLTILTQFFISIVSLPFTFGTMWDFYKDYFTALGASRGNIDPDVFAQLQRSVGPSIAIGSGISALLSLLITPIFMVVMYYDLRAREGGGMAVEKQPIAIQENPLEPMDLSSL